MKLKGIFLKAEQAGIDPKMMPVFFTIREIIRSNEDCRAAISRRWIAKTFDLDHNFVYRTIKKLKAVGWITVQTKSKAYLIARLGPAYYRSVGEPRLEPVFEPVLEPAKISKKRTDSIKAEPVFEPVLEPTQSSVVVSFSGGVDVLSSGCVVLQKGEEVGKNGLPTAPPIPATSTPLHNFLAAYNEHCPRLRQATAPNKERARLFKSECRGETKSRDYWIGVFKKINESQWATGRIPGRDGTYYKADVSFVLRHHVDIIEGKYELLKATAPTALKRYQETLPEESSLPDADFLAEHHRKLREGAVA